MPRDGAGKITGFIDQKMINVNIGRGPGQIRRKQIDLLGGPLEATNTLLGTIQFGAETIMYPQKYGARYQDFGVRTLYITKITVAKLTACHSGDYTAKKMTCSRASYQGLCEVGLAVSPGFIKKQSDCAAHCAKNKKKFKNPYFRTAKDKSACIKGCAEALKIARDPRVELVVPWPEKGFDAATKSDELAREHDQKVFDDWKAAVLYQAEKPGNDFKKFAECEQYDKQLFMAAKS
jgi:hypothetical protein